jgi:hypothetical protein
MNNPWFAVENKLWLIFQNRREYYSSIAVKEINLSKREIILSGTLPDGMKLNQFPPNSSLEIRYHEAGRCDRYENTIYTRIALFDCTLLDCRIIEPIITCLSERYIEILATIKFMEFKFNENNPN